ncbi:MAG: DNA adenine methylase, partial [Chloroflexota bacterium]
SKQRMAHEIISYFPVEFGTYFEPFLGSGGVLSTLVPKIAIASDTFAPLMEIWQTLKKSPAVLKKWYRDRWQKMMDGNKVEVYEEIKASYNSKPNGADLLFLTRSCYGGVVRFRKADGYMSTPCGIHKPISPESFSRRVDEWHKRVSGATFLQLDYEEAMSLAKPGDLIYCDPPYSHSQAILYGAQSFDLEHLLSVIEKCKQRGVFVALSIDGTKRSGNLICDLPLPNGLFEREMLIDIGHSMLKRFQMNGKTLDGERVADRLLLTKSFASPTSHLRAFHQPPYLQRDSLRFIAL